MSWPQGFNSPPPSWESEPSHVLGTLTNDDAAAGDVGEIIKSTLLVAAAVVLAGGAGSNVQSISLSPGDWDICSYTNFALTGVTGSPFQSGPSLVSATLPTQPGGGGLGTDPLCINDIPVIGLTSTRNQQTGPTRLTIPAGPNVTVYHVAQASFSLGSAKAYGTIRATRRR